jgi:cobalt/nickel transport system ATP-binding protein
VFYDDELLERANLHPPSPVRLARRAGVDATARPVTESELVALLRTGSDGTPAVRTSAPDGSRRE